MVGREAADPQKGKSSLEGEPFQWNHAYAPDANIRWAPFLAGLFEISCEFSAPSTTAGSPYNM
jgi:hypothetical protein